MASKRRRTRGSKEEIDGASQTVEGELGDKGFVGERFGFVDIALAPFYSCLYAYETCGSFQHRGRVPQTDGMG